MTFETTCPVSLCAYRNSFGYCSLNGGCIFTSKTVEVPTQKEVTPLEKTITPDIVYKEFMGLVNDLCLWDIADGENGYELKTRCLYYIQGVHDMADQLIKRLEGKK